MGASTIAGRQRPLDALDAALRRAEAGAGVLAGVLGEAGAGKTHLLGELAARARDRGTTVAWGTCWEGGGAPALWPWMQVLRSCGEEGALDAADLSTLAAASVDQSRFPVFLRVADALDRATDRGPLLVVIDDVHWADDDSLALVSFVARQHAARRLALVVAARPDELAPDALAALVAGGETHTLTALEPADVATLVRQTVGRELTADEAVVFRDRTNGNPLFVREMARLIGPSGGVSIATLALPAGVKAVLTRRLARVPQPSVAVLRALAAVGPAAPIDLLAAVLERPSIEVRGVLEAAAAAAIVVVEDGPPATARFTHGLLRDAVEDDTVAGERLHLHERIARIMAARAADPDRWSAVAWHLARAGADPAEVATASISAAGRALDVLAYADAAGHLERALDASRSAGAPTAELDALSLRLGDALLRAGDLLRAREVFVEVAEQARRDGRATTLAYAALGLGAGLAGFEVSLFDPGQVWLLQEAIGALGDGDPALRALLLGRLAVAAFRFPAAGDPVALANDAVATARAAGDDRALAYGLAALCDAIPAPARAAQRLAHATEVVDIGRRLEPALELLGRRLRLRALLELGDLHAAAAEVTSYEAVANRVQQPLYSWYVPLWRVMFAVCRGELDAALALASEARAVGVTAGSENAAMLTDTVDAAVAMYRDEPAATSVFDAYLDHMGEWSALAASASWYALRQGDLDAASRIYWMHAGDRFARLDDDAEQLVTCMAFAEVAIALGDAEGLQALRDRLLPHADLCLVDGIGGAWFGPAHLVLARIDLALGRRDEAREHAEAAVALLAGRGAPMVELLAAALLEEIGTAAPPPAAGAVFRKAGEVWELAWDGATHLFRDAKGLADLAVLLAHAGADVHVSELAGAVAGDAGTRIDRSALRAYRERLAELDAELAEADADHDAGRSERLGVERDHLLEEVA
ncbi:MAG TPA: AAA family ATPase, partial [Acidimicrobiales bacterium]|nr:AAA family ATPase [Acidimicrobiales bacterium]